MVSGKITYKGQAVNGGTLMMVNTGDKGESTNVPLTQEGTYRAADLPEGEYKVVIQPASGTAGVPSTKGMDPAKAAEIKSKIDAMKTAATITIPDKYKKVATTDLKLTVGKTDQTFDFELKD
ncbi:hypothetical protein [Fimbriiglobus ruber]|uniref:Carboxypeptidase regulatory-like domain-containing protein n=1 Tax=Fimbriiglobus ruber TaxID=1908690 RepID=A0A225DDU7_9BACT|nr:hypothetical protein [Fimbriiglobus ruber]OWK34575.1 hypothetical protein FRUB_10546 [Fimbriiglobus ruber]